MLEGKKTQFAFLSVLQSFLPSLSLTLEEAEKPGLLSEGYVIALH